MEVIQQTLIPGRSFELHDLARNTIGIAFSLTVVMIIRHILDLMTERRAIA